jgi:hypothetical protein
MTGRSSLLAAVMPMPAVGGIVSVITGPDWHILAQVTTSSPATQTENIRKLICWRSPTPLTHHSPRQTRHPRVIPPPLNDQLSIPGQRWITVVEKATVFRSSGCHQRHATLAPATSAPGIHEPFPPHHNSHPKGDADLRHQPATPADAANPYPKRSHSRRISSSQHAPRATFRHIRTPSRRPPIPATNPTCTPTPSTTGSRI